MSNCLAEVEGLLPIVNEALRSFEKGDAAADAVATNVIEAILCSQHLTETFQSLLDLGGIEAGQLQHLPRPTLVRSVLEQAAKQARSAHHLSQ